MPKLLAPSGVASKLSVAAAFLDGVVPPPHKDAQARYNRSFEYDSMGDRYARFLMTEILPEVEKRLGVHRARRVSPSNYAVWPNFWSPGGGLPLPSTSRSLPAPTSALTEQLKDILDRAVVGQRLEEQEVVSLFNARGEDFERVCETANRLREKVNGEKQTFFRLTPISSLISLTKQFSGVSFFSSFPPGNSQKPSINLPLGLSQIKTLPS